MLMSAFHFPDVYVRLIRITAMAQCCFLQFNRVALVVNLQTNVTRVVLRFGYSMHWVHKFLEWAIPMTCTTFVADGYIRLVDV